MRYGSQIKVAPYPQLQRPPFPWADQFLATHSYRVWGSPPTQLEAILGLPRTLVCFSIVCLCACVQVELAVRKGLGMRVPYPMHSASPANMQHTEPWGG